MVALENLLRAQLNGQEFLYSVELVLGRDHDIGDAERFVRDASGEPDGVKIISATDSPGGNPAIGPEGFVSYVVDHGLTPIGHLSGKGRQPELPWKAASTCWRTWGWRTSSR